MLLFKTIFNFLYADLHVIGFLSVGSIAQAAASGLLKIPSSVDVVDLTSGNSNPEPPKPQDKGKFYFHYATQFV